MTNLLEKTLLLGFGILTITIFSALLIPFLGSITEYNHNEKNSIESYIMFINKVDQGIIYVINRPKEIYMREVDYPNDLNVSFYDHLIKYEFNLENETCVRFIEYNITFFKKSFYNITPRKYILNISMCSTLIKVNFNSIL
ncbi:MAG: hypothetical protein ACFFC3_09435 [Candidatus Odinarchaeota archaeon]